MTASYAVHRDEGGMTLDVEAIRADFPILAKPVHGKRLAYLDSGASAQKPRPVLEALRKGYEDEYANEEEDRQHQDYAQ